MRTSNGTIVKPVVALDPLMSTLIKFDCTFSDAFTTMKESF